MKILAIAILIFAAISFDNKVIAQPECGNINECVQKAVEAAFQAKAALAIAVPRGAVMAFDLSECPSGWSSFDRLNGRVIVGSGDGSGLTARNHKDEGGKESVRLTIEQMPMHSHSQVWGQIAGSGSAAHGNNLATYREHTMIQSTRQSGGKESHENMPPFHVLTYCKRE